MLSAEVWTRFKVDAYGCRLWQGAISPNGYGTCRVEGRQVSAHRAFYEHFVGLIPEGMTIDHLCKVKHCVETMHMEVVTRTENVRRMGPRHPRGPVLLPPHIAHGTLSTSINYRCSCSACKAAMRDRYRVKYAASVK